MANFAFNVAPF